MTVAQLIAFLKTQPQDLQVAYTACSEQCLLAPEQIVVRELGTERPDGWVPNKRTNNGAQLYLVFPGN
jgi:hypothetical protein